jgi:hypothetical protein
MAIWGLCDAPVASCEQPVRVAPIPDIDSGDNDVMGSDSAHARRARITVRRYSSAAEADRHDLEFWMQLPDAERILQAWRLSQELWRLRGDLPDEPGLCRSVAHVRRR